MTIQQQADQILARSDNEMDELLARLVQDRDALLSALKAVMEQFEAGYFVRNTDDDGAPGWAMRAIRPMQILSAAQFAIDQAEAHQ